MRRALLALAAVTVAASWGAGAPHARPSAPHGASGWATPAELGWLDRLGGFSVWTSTELKAGHDTALAGCRTHLDATGAPPTRRLLRSLSLARAGCDALVRYAGDGHQPAVLAQARVLLGRAFASALVGLDQHLPVLQGSTPNSHTDPLLDRAASAVAGTRVSVRCWSDSDWGRILAELAALRLATLGGPGVILGFDPVAGSRAVDLGPLECEELGVIELGGVSTTGKGAILAGRAVDVLAHEAEHARGIAGEAQAECDAVQNIPVVAHVFGLSTAVARALQRATWRTENVLPAVYHSPECRNGGRFDLHPGSDRWP